MYICSPILQVTLRILSQQRCICNSLHISNNTLALRKCTNLLCPLMAHLQPLLFQQHNRTSLRHPFLLLNHPLLTLVIQPMLPIWPIRHLTCLRKMPLQLNSLRMRSLRSTRLFFLRHPLKSFPTMPLSNQRYTFYMRIKYIPDW